VNFKADGMASGIYFYVMKADNVSQIRKMILLDSIFLHNCDLPPVQAAGRLLTRICH